MPITVDPQAVYDALRDLLGARLTLPTYTGDAGTVVDDFQDATDEGGATRPTKAATLRVAERAAGDASRAFPRAATGDEATLTNWAALTAAIQLEGAWYPEQVSDERSPARLWQSELERLDDMLLDRIGPLDPDAPGGGGVDPETGAPASAVWAFGDGCEELAPDAEVYRDPRRWQSGVWIVQS